nr:carboxylesterase family protein [Bacteroidales bacterium]
MKKIILSVMTLSVILAAVSCKNDKDENFFSRTDQQLYIGDDIAIANTQYGKVRGYIMRDTYTFLGIPYGASTAGENRFMPAKPPQPWDGVKDAVFYGACAPQSIMKYPNNIATFLDCWNYFDMSEDCLNLNVWTPGLDNAKRPVIMWIHGGGFSSGNSIEHHEYHGENFSHYTNAVFVSPNHRLNSIGFTDFSGVDPKFKDSGNVGILDLVEALKWVHNNIANFGGDPDNVTIIGQSGGGAKVCNLVAMPETKGLIHKAVAL